MSNREVTPKDRIRDILGHDVDLLSIKEFTYSWSEGYERLELKNKHKGGTMYEGQFHPNGYCEGNSICHHCGRTL